MRRPVLASNPITVRNVFCRKEPGSQDQCRVAFERHAAADHVCGDGAAEQVSTRAGRRDSRNP